MKKLFSLLISLLFFTSIYSAEPKQKQLLTPEETLKVLENIKDKAITFGNGDKEIHTFIDPYCELSQRYLEFIFNKQERMFSQYTFYFYLYELKGKNSTKMIETILSSEYKNKILKSVMLEHQKIDYDNNGEVDEIIEDIAEKAKQIGVFKRPYIIINGKVK